MNLVRRAATQVGGAGLSLSDLDRMMDMAYSGSPSYTGKLVSQTTALAVDTVWAAIQAKSDDIAHLDFYPAQIQDDGESEEPARKHYLWDIFQLQANRELTAFRFRQLMQAWLMLWGNAYAEIEISGRGQVIGLWPWRPDRVKITRQTRFGELIYTYTTQDNVKFIVPAHRMLHLREFGIDGLTGLSPIEYHKQTIGLNLAIQEHGARFFGQGARPLGVLQTPQKLGDKAYNRLKQDWAKSHQGLDNAHRVAILEEGLTWSEEGVNMVDAQYIEAFGMTDKAIARLYKMPLHRLGLDDNGGSSTVEQRALEYIQTSLAPSATNWTQECRASLLSESEAQTILIRTDYTGFLLADYASLSKLISTQRQWGIASGDEIRRKYFRWNKLPDGRGEDVWQPSNMQADAGDNGNAAKPPQMVITPGKGNQPNPPPTKPNGKPNGVAHQ